MAREERCPGSTCKDTGPVLGPRHEEQGEWVTPEGFSEEIITG